MRKRELIASAMSGALQRTREKTAKLDGRVLNYLVVFVLGLFAAISTFTFAFSLIALTPWVRPSDPQLQEDRWLFVVLIAIAGLCVALGRDRWARGLGIAVVTVGSALCSAAWTNRIVADIKSEGTEDKWWYASQVESSATVAYLAFTVAGAALLLFIRARAETAKVGELSPPFKQRRLGWFLTLLAGAVVVLTSVITAELLQRVTDDALPPPFASVMGVAAVLGVIGLLLPSPALQHLGRTFVGFAFVVGLAGFTTTAGILYAQRVPESIDTQGSVVTVTVGSDEPDVVVAAIADTRAAYGVFLLGLVVASLFAAGQSACRKQPGVIEPSGAEAAKGEEGHPHRWGG